MGGSKPKNFTMKILNFRKGNYTKNEDFRNKLKGVVRTAKGLQAAWKLFKITMLGAQEK